MFDGNFRESVDKVTTPMGKFLQRIGVSADVITVIGVSMSAGCAVAIATGNFFVGAALLAATGIPDALDGAVAKAGGTAGPRGAFFDSVSDRLSDAMLFAGAAWYYAGTETPRMALLPFAVFIVAILVSYMRAKAESLSFDAKGGLMERAERFIALGIGLFFAEFFGAVILTVTLWIMLVLTVLTAAFRFQKVWKQASVVTPVRQPMTRERRHAAADEARNARKKWRQDRSDITKDRLENLRNRS